MEFLIVIELFFTRFTADAVRANIDWKSLLEDAMFEWGGSLWSQISGRRGRPLPTICALIDRPVTPLLTVFVQSNFVADFLRDTERKPVTLHF